MHPCKSKRFAWGHPKSSPPEPEDTPRAGSPPEKSSTSQSLRRQLNGKKRALSGPAPQPTPHLPMGRGVWAPELLFFRGSGRKANWQRTQSGQCWSWQQFPSEITVSTKRKGYVTYLGNAELWLLLTSATGTLGTKTSRSHCILTAALMTILLPQIQTFWTGVRLKRQLGHGFKFPSVQTCNTLAKNTSETIHHLPVGTFPVNDGWHEKKVSFDKNSLSQTSRGETHRELGSVY